MNLEAMLNIDEDNVLAAYPDPITLGEPWTIGRGHIGPEVHKGLKWTMQQSDDAFHTDIINAVREVNKAFPWVSQLNVPRQAVVYGMAFQMGVPRLKGFVKALTAMRDGHWATARAEMEDSDWARQTPKRARRRAYQMETGEWQ